MPCFLNIYNFYYIVFCLHLQCNPPLIYWLVKVKVPNGRFVFARALFRVRCVPVCL